MRKSTFILSAIIVILIVVGIVMYSKRTVSLTTTDTITPTTVVVTNTEPAPEPNPTRQGGVPTAVTSARAVPTDTTVVMTGQVTPNGASTRYWYQYGLTNNLGKLTTSQIIGSGYASLTAPTYLIGLTKDTTYYYRLVAENAFGASLGAIYSFKTTHNLSAPVGNIPTVKTASASAITTTGGTLNGQVTANKAATTYWFEYGKNADLGNTTASVLIRDTSVLYPANVTLTNLEAATTYYFRLNAQNQFGTVNGQTLNFKTGSAGTTVAPVVVTKSASAIATSSAVAHGTVTPGGLETTYWAEYSTDGSFATNVTRSTEKKSAGAGLKAISVDLTLPNLTTKTNYYFRVVAENTIGIVHGNRLSLKTK